MWDSCLSFENTKWWLSISAINHPVFYSFDFQFHESKMGNWSQLWSNLKIDYFQILWFYFQYYSYLICWHFFFLTVLIKNFQSLLNNFNRNNNIIYLGNHICLFRKDLIKFYNFNDKSKEINGFGNDIAASIYIIYANT